jgi:hypothetical protein
MIFLFFKIWFNLYTIFSILFYFKGKDWMSYSRINGSENDFMKNLYDREIFVFIFVRFKEQMKIY